MLGGGGGGLYRKPIQAVKSSWLDKPHAVVWRGSSWVI